MDRGTEGTVRPVPTASHIYSAQTHRLFSAFVRGKNGKYAQPGIRRRCAIILNDDTTENKYEKCFLKCQPGIAFEKTRFAKKRDAKSSVTERKSTETSV